MKVIEVKGLTKSYGDFTAVAGIDLAIEAGEIFALLGPNGAGKTTTVEILARLSILQKAVVAAHRRHAVVGLVVVSACVTPTSDPFNLALMFVPLYGLFELGLAGMGWAERNSSVGRKSPTDHPAL